MKIDHAYVKMEFKNKNRWKTTIILREGFMRKNSRSFGFCPNYFSLVFKLLAFWRKTNYITELRRMNVDSCD